MVAFIFSLVSVFSSPWQDQTNPILLADSVKRPPRAHQQLSDSTGRFLEVNRIFIVGNRITRDQIVLRELTLKTGDLIYSHDLPGVLEVDRKKLINTRLFNTVDIRTLELQPDRIDLLIDLNERWYTFPSPIFELSDRNFNEWWQNYNHDFSRVNYGLRLYQYNMRGRNETLRFIAQFGYTRRFGISYRVPYVDKKQRHGLQFDFDYTETKNLAYQTEDHKLVYKESDDMLRVARFGGITYTYRPSFYESHSFSVGYRSVTIDDSVRFWNPRYFDSESLSQQYGTMSYQFTSDHRDYVGYPLRGYYLNAIATKTGIYPSDDVEKLEATATFAAFFDFSKNFYLSNNTVGYWSTPDDVPYYNFGALGYQKQIVRGYEIYVIEGPQYILNKTTFKKRIFARTYHWGDMPISQFRHVPLSIYFKVYGDLGYVNNYPDYAVNGRLTNKVLTGIGAGFDIVGSYDAVLRFEYTLNGEKEHGFFFHLKKEF